MSYQQKVVISSTARDLPEHRKEVLDACLRQDMFPAMMEHLPACDAEAISASLRLVDEADIYVGVLGHRYGYVPKENNPQQISITEMEYDRAVERKIPRLIFIIDEKHPLADFTISDIDKGQDAVKLAQLKSRIETNNIVNYFKSPADLRAHVINGLSKLRKRDLTTFHYVGDIPQPPEPFIAHPYTLLRTHRLIGRQTELNLLTDWVARPDAEVYQARILNVISIGGLGKSALTWKWFNDIAVQEMRPLAGRLWWSFYESDASFENFVTRALAYVTMAKLYEVQKISMPEREEQLLATLNRQPFVVVLDGLERILIAYARIDATRLEDSQVEGQRRQRKATNPLAGRFLKKLAQVKNSRILVSSRLYPAELETEGGDPLPGSFRCDLPGLIDEDAVEIWRSFEVSGSRDLLVPVFDTFDKHPLLIQALAGEIKRYRPAPGDFEEWCKDNPQFDPTKFPRLQDVMSHVLEFPLRGLNQRAQQALQNIAAFRMPARYDTLAALLIGKGKKSCRNEQELDEVLSELEDRGLVGWDKRANRYDLHPIVRGLVWEMLNARAQRGIISKLHNYFDAAIRSNNSNIESVDDLTPAIELYNALIGLKRFYEAYEVYSYRLEGPLSRLGRSKLQTELLNPLVKSIHDDSLWGGDANSIFGAHVTIGRAFSKNGQLHTALPFFCCAQCLSVASPMLGPCPWLLKDMAYLMLLGGHLYVAQDALIVSTDYPESLAMSGILFAVRGQKEEFNTLINNAMASLNTALFGSDVGSVIQALAQGNIWLKQFDVAFTSLATSSPTATRDDDANFIWADRLRGEAALGLNDSAIAGEWLHRALARARAANLIEEELPTLVALGELRRRQGNLQAARELLDDVWDPAAQGPYRLIHADACNVLAEIERDEGNMAAAVEAASRAYALAWCDGPPFAYNLGLVTAGQHLQELDAPEPEMPPFDESKFEREPEGWNVDK